jgi:hypothetical protein
VPRQSRRSRIQSTGRKRSEPLAPRHPHLRSSPMVLDAEDQALEIDEEETAQSVYVAPVVERRFTAPAVPSVPNPFRRPSAAALAREGAVAPSKLTSTDYGYVVGELKRIFITAAVVILMLVVVALIKR